MGLPARYLFATKTNGYCKQKEWICRRDELVTGLLASWSVRA